MSTQQVLNLPTTISASAIDNVLKGLEQTNELAYFRRVGGRHGFVVTTRWGSTLENLKNTLNDPIKQNTPANYSNLRLITLKIITSANHYYTIDYIKGGNANSIQALTGYKGFAKTFSSVFPEKLEDETGLPPVTGHFITSVENMGDGIAIIYSYVVLKTENGRRKMRSNQYPEQYFNTVFIPNDLSRVEYRVDKHIGKRAADKAMDDLRAKFIELLNELNITLTLQTVNFYKAIMKIYNDKKYGRLVQVDFLDPNSDEDAVLRGRSEPNYDGRYREVISKTRNNKPSTLNLQVAGLAVRLDSKILKETVSNEIGFEPSKTDWSVNKFCGGFYFTQAADHQVHYGVINDILTRAK
ncbi:hypothetical protein ACQ26G_002416 [Yersinia enterocolitica]|uniref:hypothetical protein n=1 Tax=Yersinia enterocolitica TaxID=630 RepID=UPI0005DEA462|nr:hypothetical protein [Yersinia enterocolitica]EKN3444224.1 hypothetical protein [Yersinia enterocolitica]EKN4756429.1 hypothetical protein [Yersinia enterocolitica]EKN4797522.1 hypothetical protein [Yersinia enterocolitica]EKN5107816.1 hypothetical protein [Yersinia enterocolitica]CQH45371.1 Uncharacterised protein [Yersinia enterocolitica]